MSDYFGAAGDLLQGAGSLFGGLTAAAGDRKAADFYGRAAALTGVASGLKETAVTRQVYQTLGGARADVAANGLTQTGSAEDVLRSSAQQGALSKALVSIQGNIDVQSLLAKQADAKAQAAASSGGGFFGALKGIVGAAAAFI